MRIVQVLSPTASPFERKNQRVDFAALRANHDVTCVSKFAEIETADLAHVYTSPDAASASFRGIKVPIVTNVRVRSGWLRRGAVAAISPIEEEGFTLVPEAVEDTYGVERARPRRNAIGFYARDALRNVVELTIARVHRTREDIEWLQFSGIPSPDDFARVDMWIDPAIGDRDFDGFTAEALVSGLPVVASRTPINVQRLEKGRTGLLVPPNDPNELTHAILSTLFKPEVAQQKIDAARQTMAKFRPRQRVRALTAIYESLK